jgi:hypothetical protein
MAHSTYCYAECHCISNETQHLVFNTVFYRYAERHSAVCRNAECCGAIKTPRSVGGTTMERNQL